MSSEPLKRCSKCREEKPLGDFHRDARKPDGRKYVCKECGRDGANERARRWREKNPERARDYERRWREENPEKVREMRRRRIVDGRSAETNRSMRARYAARSPEQIEADRARLRPDGLKKCRSGHRLTFEAFSVSVATPDGLSDKCRECAGEALSAWRYGAYAPSWEDRGLYSCYLCGAPYEHADHKHPKALGGSDSPENLAPACAACNLSKSDTPLDEFRPDLFALVASWPCEIRLVSAA